MATVPPIRVNVTPTLDPDVRNRLRAVKDALDELGSCVGDLLESLDKLQVTVSDDASL